MSILNIKEKLAQRIQNATAESENTEYKSSKTPQQPELYESLRETEVGISHYLNDLPGFDGAIKQRYSDFSVHEIDKEGNVLVLNSYDLPDESPPKLACDIQLLSENTIADLDQLLAGTRTECVDIDVTDNSKEERKQMHQLIKEKYGSVVSANTHDKNDKKIISVSLSKDGKGDQNRWPGHLPCFLHFTLFKANMTTNMVCNLLAKRFNIKVDNFQTAGTKDKRAITTQRMSVKNMRAKRLLNLKGLRGVGIGNFEYKNYPLSLGYLHGNRFEIALREVTASDEIIEKAMTSLKEHGFINYYGMQRFGAYADSPTHQIGKLLIKEQYGQAASLILKPRSDYDQPDLRSAREIYAKTKNAHAAFGAIRNKRCIEGQLLNGLKINGPNAFANAFDALPRNMRILYIHAYQSHIWNKVVSQRIEKFGKTVLKGDLVITKTEKNICENGETSQDKVPIDKNDLEEELITEDGVVENQDVAEKAEKPCPVRQISEEETSLFTLYDVLLPLPGHSVIYPKNETLEIYDKVLAEDGLNTESFLTRVRKYSLYGTYRQILKKPANLSWKTVKYDKKDDCLILSDLEKLEGKKLPEEKGERKAIILTMDLDKCTYATMALREILRCDTSSGNQAKLTMKRNASGNDDQPANKKINNEGNGFDENQVDESLKPTEQNIELSEKSMDHE